MTFNWLLLFLLLPLLLVVSADNNSQRQRQFNCPNGGEPKADERTGKPLQCLPGRRSSSAICGLHHSCFFSGFNYQCCPSLSEDEDENNFVNQQSIETEHRQQPTADDDMAENECPAGSFSVFGPEGTLLRRACSVMLECRCKFVVNDLRATDPTTTRRIKRNQEEKPMPLSSQGEKPRPLGSQEEKPRPLGIRPMDSQEEKPMPLGSQEEKPMPLGSQEEKPRPLGSQEEKPMPLGSQEEKPMPLGSQEEKPRPLGIRPMDNQEEKPMPLGIRRMEEKLTARRESVRPSLAAAERPPPSQPKKRIQQAAKTQQRIGQDEDEHGTESKEQKRNTNNFNKFNNNNNNKEEEYAPTKMLKELINVEDEPTQQHRTASQQYILEKISDGWPYDDKFYRPTNNNNNEVPFPGDGCRHGHRLIDLCKMSGRGKNKKSSFRERKGITYQQGSDPPFLAQFKSKIGYKEWTFKSDDEGEEEGPSEDRDDIRNMREEERPQVVVLNPNTDLSADELQKEIDKGREEEDRRKILEGKIVFRKPEKRRKEEEQKQEVGKTEEKKSRREAEAKPTHPQQDRRLLSFGDDQNE
ncbi:hypothetical protein GPALN_006369 [Globodera pallida]|nr:hypothetical protein GPALN_006369 [Globodera pallida]